MSRSSRPNPDAIFHPKVWFIRYRQPDSGTLAFRLLCMSRNLTFDRSWDTILRLEGELSDTVHHRELREFAAALPRMAEAVKPITEDRRAAIDALAAELERVKWTGPEGMEIERFWPLGHDGLRSMAFHRPRRPLLRCVAIRDERRPRTTDQRRPWLNPALSPRDTRPTRRQGN